MYIQPLSQVDLLQAYSTSAVASLVLGGESGLDQGRGGVRRVLKLEKTLLNEVAKGPLSTTPLYSTTPFQLISFINLYQVFSTIAKSYFFTLLTIGY